MRAFHGTHSQFDEFENKHISSGEGVAKRGHGFNFCMDKAVARYFADCAEGDTGWIAEVRIPDQTDLLDLDSPLLSAVRDIDSLVSRLMSQHGITFGAIFVDASSHDQINMSYSDDRAEEMLRRLFINYRDNEAREELLEWSPGFDWDSLIQQLNSIGLELNINEDTGEDLLKSLGAVFDHDDQRVNLFLLDCAIYGTFGKEPYSKDPDARSAVIFRASDITIMSWSSFEKDLSISPSL